MKQHRLVRVRKVEEDGEGDGGEAKSTLARQRIKDQGRGPKGGGQLSRLLLQEVNNEE